MDLTTILIIFAVVLVISLILRIFFAITKVLIIIAIILAIGAGVFYWFNYAFKQVFCKNRKYF